MITAISNLEPKSLWNIFEEITNIPRPSDHEEKIADFIINFAKTHNLKWEQDAIGNVIVDIEATEDKKHSPCVILQGHMDMVAVVENGYEPEFGARPVKRAIQTYLENPLAKLMLSDGIKDNSRLKVYAENGLNVLSFKSE